VLLTSASSSSSLYVRNFDESEIITAGGFDIAHQLYYLTSKIQFWQLDNGVLCHYCWRRWCVVVYCSCALTGCFTE